METMYLHGSFQTFTRLMHKPLVRARACQLPKSAFHPSSNTNNNKTSAQSMSNPGFHSSVTSNCALWNRIGGTEEEQEGL